jgi:alkanesulfonate monooxygenase SsuD/methylene tetrahydromethanopterin reductase-like flavin-dependent oxidoreductase (luciferase family)
VRTPVIECWTTLTFLAARYPQLRWGTIVLCQSYRNPALLAKMVANLCALLPGRVIFGIGAGWKEDEYRAYGYAFPRPAVRIRQLRETVEVAKLLWTADDATYAGQHYRVDHAHLHPKPDPLPPIMIGGAASG